MLDDPRIKRVLKRYRKDEQFSDGIMDVTALGDAFWLAACGCQNESDLCAPQELDQQALAALTQRMGIGFDQSEFDYFLHTYIRSGQFDDYHADPTVTRYPVSEDGPPANIPVSEGYRWCEARPQEGKANFVEIPIEPAEVEPSNEPSAAETPL